MPRMHSAGAESLSARLQARLRKLIAQSGGWLAFDRFMATALYEPGLGYYARGSHETVESQPAAGLGDELAQARVESRR